MNSKTTDWKIILEQEYKISKDISPKEFTCKYSSLIDGSEQYIKCRKVKRVLYNLEHFGSIINPYCNNAVSHTNTNEKVYRETNVSVNYKPTIIDNKWSGASTLKFALMGDTQFGSKYAQLTYLNTFYDICVSEGVTKVYHTGDITDGENMRPGHAYDNYVHGATDHVKEIVKNYPYREGVTTSFITGNHDASFRKSCGLDIGSMISDKRSDLIYLGRDIVQVNLTPLVTLGLRHPWDGSAYALSYKPQKMIESMDEELRPTILGIGHYHKLEYLYYLGVHCFQTGAFQSATPFTISKGIRVALGGWIITLELDKNGELLSITPKAITFKNGIPDDYINYLN